MDAIAESTDCSEAKTVGESYGECVGDIEDASCSALFPTVGTPRTSCGRSQFLRATVSVCYWA
jgi:hypothetical protein